MSCKLQIKIAIDSEVVLQYFLHSDPLKQLSQSGTKQSKSYLYRVQGDNAFPVSCRGLWTFKWHFLTEICSCGKKWEERWDQEGFQCAGTVFLPCLCLWQKRLGDVLVGTAVVLKNKHKPALVTTKEKPKCIKTSARCSVWAVLHGSSEPLTVWVKAPYIKFMGPMGVFLVDYIQSSSCNAGMKQSVNQLA